MPKSDGRFPYCTENSLRGKVSNLDKFARLETSDYLSGLEILEGRVIEIDYENEVLQVAGTISTKVLIPFSEILYKLSEDRSINYEGFLNRHIHFVITGKRNGAVWGSRRELQRKILLQLKDDLDEECVNIVGIARGQTKNGNVRVEICSGILEELSFSLIRSRFRQGKLESQEGRSILGKKMNLLVKAVELPDTDLEKATGRKGGTGKCKNGTTEDRGEARESRGEARESRGEARESRGEARESRGAADFRIIVYEVGNTFSENDLLYVDLENRVGIFKVGETLTKTELLQNSNTVNEAILDLQRSEVTIQEIKAQLENIPKDKLACFCIKGLKIIQNRNNQLKDKYVQGTLGLGNDEEKDGLATDEENDGLENNPDDVNCEKSGSNIDTEENREENRVTAEEPQKKLRFLGIQRIQDRYFRGNLELQGDILALLYDGIAMTSNSLFNVLHPSYSWLSKPRLKDVLVWMYVNRYLTLCEFDVMPGRKVKISLKCPERAQTGEIEVPAGTRWVATLPPKLRFSINNCMFSTRNSEVCQDKVSSNIETSSNYVRSAIQESPKLQNVIDYSPIFKVVSVGDFVEQHLIRSVVLEEVLTSECSSWGSEKVVLRGSFPILKSGVTTDLLDLPVEIQELVKRVIVTDAGFQEDDCKDGENTKVTFRII